MTENERLLERIARAWADQESVDWGAAEHSTLTTAQLEQLRALDDVTRALRRVQQEANTGGNVRAPPLFRWGPLEIQEKLGAGAQGEIYRAYDPLLAQPVALKLFRGDSLHSPSLTQQLQEVRGLARVRHRHVLSVYGAAEYDGRFGIWTELIDGTTLEQVLAERGPFAVDDALAIGRDLGLALDAVHARGLIHGDVKPGNVLRERGGRIVLADFGACRMQCDAMSQSTISGTFHYLPPEVLDGAAADAAIDAYALGVVLYRLLSGRYPYSADTLETLRTIQLAGAPERLRRIRPDVPEALSQLLDRMLDPDPAQRLSHVSEVIDALGAIARSRHPAHASRRLRSGYALIAISMIAIVAGVVWWSGRTVVPGDAAMTFNREGNGQLAALPALATLQSGDLLALTLALPQSSFVYILNEDSSGRLSALFPLPDLDRRNPLPAGAMELPGNLHGQPFRWRVSSSATSEEFLVVVAPTAIAEIEATLEHAVQPTAVAETERGVDVLQARGRPLPRFNGAGLASLAAQLSRRPDFERLQLRRFEYAQRD